MDTNSTNLLVRSCKESDLDEIKLITADSTSDKTFKKIKKMCGKYKNILIHLDSDHTKQHVFKEINLYSKLLKKNNYLIVGDTIIENIPKQKHVPIYF